MEKIRREIRLFFVSYGNLILYVIGIVLLVILVIQGLNNIVKEQKAKNEIVLTEEEKVQIQIQEKKNKEHEEYISKFINYCNTNKIEEAYEMLSENCKQEKYQNIQKFKEEYINKVYNINICEYEIIKENEKYIIKLTQDILATGRTDSIIEGTYLIENMLEEKIYIYN